MNSNNKKFIGILAVILAVAVGGAVLAFMAGVKQLRMIQSPANILLERP